MFITWQNRGVTTLLEDRSLDMVMGGLQNGRGVKSGFTPTKLGCGKGFSLTGEGWVSQGGLR